MGQTVMIWQPKLGDPDDHEQETKTATRDSNIEGLKVQEWPDFTAKKKAVKKKKVVQKEWFHFVIFKFAKFKCL